MVIVKWLQIKNGGENYNKGTNLKEKKLKLGDIIFHFLRKCGCELGKENIWSYWCICVSVSDLDCDFEANLPNAPAYCALVASCRMGLNSEVLWELMY